MLSLIVPTRGRAPALRRMMDSLRATAKDARSLEVILVMDQDDPASLEFTFAGLSWQRVVVPPGQTMGNLNREGCRAARGRYFMLLNDDVEARTPGWDLQLRRLLEGYPDGIVLAHVNDLVFRDRLCTFPCIPREFCEIAGGICPPEYRSYRIDDHIHHVFDLLRVMGYARRVFLPELVFEHHHGCANAAGVREYAPDPAIHEIDTAAFHRLSAARRDLALACLERIGGRLDSQARAEKLRMLEASGDPIELRRRDHARWWRPDDPTASASVAVAIVDANGAAARGMLAAVEADWPGLPAKVVARHNDALAGCKSDYLLILEPEAKITAGWIDEALGVLGRAGAIAVAGHAIALDVPRFGRLRFDASAGDPMAAFVEAARAAGAEICNWPAPGPAAPALEISPAPSGRPTADAPPSTHARYRALAAPAWLAARWPALERFGIGIPAALFDADWYRASYPALSGTRPALLHYLKEGGFTGFNPNPHFDSRWYLETNPDVASTGLNPLVHFVRYGAREGRAPNLFFDVRYYQKENPQAGAAGRNPLEHFISEGMRQGRSPCASLPLNEYLARIRARRRMRRVEVREPAPLSVVIPTRNRREKLARTLEACGRHSACCTVELCVIDDGSSDGTPDLLRGLSTRISNLRWQSAAASGPGAARNLAAAAARHDVLLFMGDDIVPASDDFFRVHAHRHAENPRRDFAVLGKVAWPKTPEFGSSFVLRHLEEDGAQFAFGRLKPETFVDWRYFYTSNLSVKKALVADWIRDGFDGGFPGAALEDVELAYRLWQSSGGVRIYYDPSSTGLHDHPYTLESFLERQRFVGRSLRHLVELHPELMDDFGIRAIDSALRTVPPRQGSGPDSSRLIRDLECHARRLEAGGELGKEEWHGPFLSALFEMCLHDGYASAWPESGNVPAAREAIVERLFSRMRRTCRGFHWPPRGEK